ncbi:MAG: AMIN domain-containing protein [Elusimicrobia bacterium]|nr:AMIN domain-containing protein [Elusimicrobiota bacterium]
MKKIIPLLSIIAIFMSGYASSQEKTHPWEELINVKVAGKTDTSVRAVIETTGKVKFHVFRVSNPPRLVVEMVDVVHNWRTKDLDVGGNIIDKIRSGQYKDDPVKITRVVMDMAVDDYYFDEVTTNNQITLAISLTEEGIEKAGKKEKEKEKEKKERPSQAETARAQEKPKKAAGNIEPNVETAEHRQEVDKVLTEKQKREEERKKRLQGIASGETGPAGAKAAPRMATQLFSDELVTFNFKEADILEVLRTFAIKINKNIVPSEAVKGEVTLRLNNVPFNEAFQMVLDRLDLVAILRSENVIEIMKRSEMPTERETFHLINRNANEVKTTLNNLLTDDESKNTNIAIDDTSNSLIVTATPEVLNKVDVLVKQLDIKSPQIKIKARLIEVQAGKDFSLGVSWFNRVSFTNPEGIQSIRATKDEGNFTRDSDDDNVIDGVSVFPEGGWMDISAVLDNTQLYGVLNLLASDSQSKTISEPTILTENNRSAKIHIGQNLPVRTLQVTETGTTQIIEFIPEGVDLAVTPVVSPGSDQISLKVNISISEFVSFVADSPVTSERSALTEVTVESGKTVVLGGLMRERITKDSSGIPLLKDIPLVGYLFKNKSDTKSKTELLIFLTPEILID